PTAIVRDMTVGMVTRLGRLAEVGPQPVTFTLAAIAPKCLHICGRVLTARQPAVKAQPTLPALSCNTSVQRFSHPLRTQISLRLSQKQAPAGAATALRNSSGSRV